MTYKEQLSKLHKLELKIALEIKRICDRHSIKYFLIAGTLLGAVRHGGFIPWDDDMDIGMLREDYNKFILACKTDLGKEYILQTWDTDKNYPFSYGKIRLLNTHFVEGFSQDGKANDGIFVDIFPFDGVPDNEKERRKQSKHYFICKRLLWIKKGYGKNISKESTKQRIKYFLFRGFSAFCVYQSVKDRFQKLQVKYNGIKTTKIVTDGSYSYERESIMRAWSDELELISFENEEFYAFKDRTEYLKHFYGDYMKLPPLEQRNRHQLLNVDFGSY